MAAYMGLSSEEAEARLDYYGPNSIPEPRYHLLRLILRQFKGVFNILLIVAAVITLALDELLDASFILFFVILGITLDVFQEYKSNVAAEKLKSYLRSTITAVRDGTDIEICTEDLVPGDIIKLESGDIVPADAVILEARNLLVDETTFTGESIPVVKTAFSRDDNTENETAGNGMLLQGIVVISGNGVAELIATGKNTKLAQISKTASTVKSESELVQGIDRISKFILKTTVFTLVLVVIANIIIEGNRSDIPHFLIFAIALAVSVIPEALPLVLTFSLSKGALKFAKEKVIVKRLSSVQDLGSINLLCTDKTGTITENRLAFAGELASEESGFSPLLLVRLAAINLDERIPEPFDKAADEALTAEQRIELSNYELIEEEAFDPSRRSNGVIVQSKDGKRIHIRRGSPEFLINQGLASEQHIDSWLTEEERMGHRVLGVSYNDGHGPQFGGYVSFVDHLKNTAQETIDNAKRMKVAITIITGDSARVAEAVGRESGLVSDSGEVVESAEFLKLPSQEQKEKAGRIRVFARTTPEQKLEIIQLLKEEYTVGYLGEGINGAPALKAANVSMVVQSAADVARETADIVLLENDLRVVVEGIRIGRETFANTMKYIRATLISNFGNFYAVAISSLFIDFLPMLPTQLLLLNLLSDFPMIAIAFDRVSEKEIAEPQHYDFQSLYIIFMTMGIVSTIFDFIYFGLFYRISPAVLQTNWFIGSVLTELLLVFSVRSMLPVSKAGRPALILIILSFTAIALTIVLPIVSASARFFQFQSPSLLHLAIIVSLAFMYLVVSEIVKRQLNRLLERRSTNRRRFI